MVDTDTSLMLSGEDGKVECPACTYDLRGRRGLVCPECGTTLKAEDLEGPRLPWSQQRALGPVRAFWFTVLLVLLRFRRFRRLVERPVDYPAALHFRTLLILLLYAPLLATTLGYVAAGQGGDLDFFNFGTVGGALATHVVLHGSLVLFLFAVTGVPSYFFHPRRLPVERQNRAIALSYYTSAPLVLILPAYLLAPVGVHLQAMGLDTAGAACLFAAAACGVAAPCWWAVVVRRLGNHVMGARHAWKLTMCVVPLWAALAVLVLGALPCLIYYMALVAYSLRP